MNERAYSFDSQLASLQQSQPNRLASLAKKTLFKLLADSEEGYLVCKEQGQKIASFGNPEHELKAEINIADTRFYRSALTGGSCAVGESFIEGWWSSPNITQLVQFFARNLSTLDRWENRLGWLLKPVSLYRKQQRKNSRQQAKRNILAHYDLGNELYQRMLDERMQYSSALFNSPQENLTQAQINKLQRLCEQLELTESDHLLEIGSGWGGLAIYAAQHYGCQVTTTTISDAQYNYAKAKIDEAGLSDQIQLLNRDYRELQGHYDKIVSVEMIEAVGEKYLPTFFKQVNDLLKPGGKLIMQAITIADQRYKSYAAGEDFIQKHIFPGGFLPSITLLSQLFNKHSCLVIRDVFDIGQDYARTLACWRNNFLAHQKDLQELGYDERFSRLWLFYLAYCEGGFLERRISTVQLLAEKSR